MKNVILGIIGVFIMLYTLLIGLNILNYQTQKNELELQVSRIVKNTLEAEFQKGENEFVEQQLLQEINESISNGNLEVEVQAIDLQKGLLSVKVTKYVEMINGKEKEIVVEKTAIVERSAVFHNGSGVYGN